MGLITAKAEGAAPATPPTGYVTLYTDGSVWKYKTDSGSVFTLSSGITAEEVQDIIGAFFADSSSIDVTYNDAGDVISATVIASGVNHNALQNYVANQHIDHSTVSITAGTGLSGGGDLTATRTLNIANVGTAGTYRSVTTNAQGQVTAGTNPTTLAGYGITDAQPLDSDLTAVASLTGTGLVTRTAAGTMATRTLTAGAGVSLTNGDGVAGNPTVALPNVGTAGTYGSSTTYPVIATDAQGRVTGVTTQTVSAVFGSEFGRFSDTTAATTTSTTFSAAATFTTASVPAGTYRIAVFFNYSHNNTGGDTRFQFQIDGSNVGPELRREPNENTNQSFWGHGFYYETFGTAATHTLTLNFAVETAGQTTTCSNVFVEFWRVN